MKKWTSSQIKSNYTDFERLLTAKLAEINAKLELGAGMPPVQSSISDANGENRNLEQWIAFHEPKINMHQKRIESLESEQKQMRDELHEKVSYAMV